MSSRKSTITEDTALLCSNFAGATLVPGGGTSALSPQPLTPIPSRSVAGSIAGDGAGGTGGGDGVPETWYQAVYCNDITRCTDMLTNMLRSPAAVQLPESLRLPLESAISEASPAFNFNMTPANNTSGPGITGSQQQQQQYASPMEGVEIAGHAPVRASSGLNLSTEFLDGFLDEAPRLSQEPDGTDGNFTQPLSPSIWTATRAADGTENTAGTDSTFKPLFLPCCNV